MYPVSTSNASEGKRKDRIRLWIKFGISCGYTKGRELRKGVERDDLVNGPQRHVGTGVRV